MSFYQPSIDSISHAPYPPRVGSTSTLEHMHARLRPRQVPRLPSTWRAVAGTSPPSSCIPHRYARRKGRPPPNSLLTISEAAHLPIAAPRFPSLSTKESMSCSTPSLPSLDQGSSTSFISRHGTEEAHDGFHVIDRLLARDTAIALLTSQLKSGCRGPKLNVERVDRHIIEPSCFEEADLGISHIQCRLLANVHCIMNRSGATPAPFASPKESTIGVTG